MKEIISKEIETKLNRLIEEFKVNYNIGILETEIQSLVEESVATLLQEEINKLMYDPVFLAILAFLAVRHGLVYKEHRLVGVTILSGRNILVFSPYFYRKKEKRPGRNKEGRQKGNNRYCHFGLSVIGFIGYYSPVLSNHVVQMALLCPSFEVARNMLKDRGVSIDVKTIRRLCQEYGEIGMSSRGEASSTGQEDVAGKTLVIGIDGGRIRERRLKRGRRKKGAKRTGFHTDWKEPKLFTICLMDESGRLDKGFSPYYDATMKGKDEVFGILSSYLNALSLEKVAKIVFVGDGAPWIWTRVEELVKDIIPDSVEAYQVLDYTHAKQALGQINELLPQTARKGKKIWNKWVKDLWEGDLDSIEKSINELLKGKELKEAMKKFNNYFRKNESRMKYSQFKSKNVPCGSGCVESAIRRVINLRLKSAGTFWLTEMAECFLFLRSQLVSGRWKVFINNCKNDLLGKDNHELVESKKQFYSNSCILNNAA